MIIVKLNGGLGNQMLQYAFGRAMSLFLKTELKFDISWFDTILEQETPRHYELECFGLAAQFATKDEIKKIKGLQALLSKRVSRILKKMNLLENKSYFLEKFYHYDPTTQLCSDNTYFEGYWQSYRYFESYQSQIKDDFLGKYKLEENNLALSQEIQSCNAVSLHVRRGDYVTNKNATDYHGVSPLDYYYQAIGQIIQEVQSPVLYIFSDDIAWVKEHLEVSLNVVYVENRAENKPFEDIYLMHLCKHNIIANSSFSWWGAYLNNYEQKIVIAPKKWFGDSSINTDDLIPTNWRRI